MHAAVLCTNQSDRNLSAWIHCTHLRCHLVLLSVKYRMPSSLKSRSLANIIGIPSISLTTDSAWPPSGPTFMMPKYGSAIQRSPVFLWNFRPKGRPQMGSYGMLGATGVLGAHTSDLMHAIRNSCISKAWTSLTLFGPYTTWCQNWVHCMRWSWLSIRCLCIKRSSVRSPTPLLWHTMPKWWNLLKVICIIRSKFWSCFSKACHPT